jgi:hypothetical protein
VADLYEHDKETLGFTKGGVYGLIWRVLALLHCVKSFTHKKVDFGTRNIKVSVLYRVTSSNVTNAYGYLMEGSPGIIQNEYNIMKSPIRDQFLILIAG